MVTLSVAEVAALLVSSIVALFVKPFAAVSVELYEAVPSTRSVEPATVVIEPGARQLEMKLTVPEFARLPPTSDAVICSVPPASTTTGPVRLLFTMGTVVPAATVNVEGPARMLVVPSRRVVPLESGALRLSVELNSATVPAPPSVPPV